MSKIDELNQAIEKENAAHDAYEKKNAAELAQIQNRLTELIREMNEKKEAHHQKVIGLQKERDALALTEKLKSFPKKLVEGHKTCSVCGAEMRPFVYLVGEKEIRKWGCQTSEPSHDLIEVG